MSVIELLTVITILGILSAIAIPSFREFLANNRVTAANNGLVTALNLARSESLRRSSAAAVCPSNDGATCTGGSDWSVGWIAFIDTDADGDLTNADATIDANQDGNVNARDALLQIWPAPGGDILGRSGTNTRFAQYNVMGMMNLAAGTDIRIAFGRPGCSGLKASETTISLIGSLRNAKVDCASHGF